MSGQAIAVLLPVVWCLVPGAWINTALGLPVTGRLLAGFRHEVGHLLATGRAGVPSGWQADHRHLCASAPKSCFRLGQAERTLAARPRAKLS
jgi:hypothetical protein